MKPLTSLLMLLPVLISAPAFAQQGTDAPLVANPESDSYAIASQIYQQARETQDANARASAMYQAANRFSEYVRNYPKAANRDQALYLLAICRAEAGDLSASNNVLEQLARGSKGEYAAAAAYKLGLQSAERQDWNKAAEYFREAKGQTKKDALRNDAQYRMAHALQQLGRRREAEEAYKAVLVLGNVRPELRNASMLAMAQMKTEDGNDAEAYALFTNLLQSGNLDNTTKGKATLQAARLASKLGKSAEAQQFYGRLRNIGGMEAYAGEAQLESLLALYNEKKYTDVVRVANQNNTTLSDPLKEARRDLIVGQSNMELKQYEAAVEWFAAAENAQPGTALAADAGYRRLISIQQVRTLNFFAEAEQYLKTYGVAGSATASLPCVDLVRFMYADRMMNVDAAAAARQFEAININQLPEGIRADAEYKKAWCASAGEQYDPVGTLNHFIDTYPKDRRLPDALALRGTALSKGGNTKEALADFDRIIAEFPESEAAAVAWQRAAQCCAKDTQSKDAQEKMIHYYEGLIQYFQSLVKRGGRNKPAAVAEAHYNIACALYDSKPADAIPHFREARTMNAEQYAALVDLRLVQCYFKMKDAEGLRQAMETLEKTNPGSYAALPPAIPRWCGWTCYQSGNYAAADKYLSDALMHEPREKYTDAGGQEQERPKVEPIVWKTLARARLELQKYAEGLQAAEFYVGMENQPYRKAEGMRDEAQLLIGLKRCADARKICEDAIAMGIDGPIKSSLFITLGDACYAEKQYSEAAKYYGRTANIVSDKELKPVALYKIASALRRGGKAGEAEQYESTLKKDFPDWHPTPAMEALMQQ